MKYLKLFKESEEKLYKIYDKSYISVYTDPDVKKISEYDTYKFKSKFTKINFIHKEYYHETECIYINNINNKVWIFFLKNDIFLLSVVIDVNGPKESYLVYKAYGWDGLNQLISDKNKLFNNSQKEKLYTNMGQSFNYLNLFKLEAIYKIPNNEIKRVELMFPNIKFKLIKEKGFPEFLQFNGKYYLSFLKDEWFLIHNMVENNFYKIDGYDGLNQFLEDKSILINESLETKEKLYRSVNDWEGHVIDNLDNSNLRSIARRIRSYFPEGIITDKYGISDLFINKKIGKKFHVWINDYKRIIIDSNQIIHIEIIIFKDEYFLCTLTNRRWSEGSSYKTKYIVDGFDGLQQFIDDFLISKYINESLETKENLYKVVSNFSGKLDFINYPEVKNLRMISPSMNSFKTLKSFFPENMLRKEWKEDERYKIKLTTQLSDFWYKNGFDYVEIKNANLRCMILFIEDEWFKAIISYRYSIVDGTYIIDGFDGLKEFIEDKILNNS